MWLHTIIFIFHSLLLTINRFYGLKIVNPLTAVQDESYENPTRWSFLLFASQAGWLVVQRENTPPRGFFTLCDPVKIVQSFFPSKRLKLSVNVYSKSHNKRIYRSILTFMNYTVLWINYSITARRNLENHIEWSTNTFANWIIR